MTRGEAPAASFQPGGCIGGAGEPRTERREEPNRGHPVIPIVSQRSLAKDGDPVPAALRSGNNTGFGKPGVCLSSI